MRSHKECPDDTEPVSRGKAGKKGNITIQASEVNWKIFHSCVRSILFLFYLYNKVSLFEKKHLNGNLSVKFEMYDLVGVSNLNIYIF